MLACRSIQVIFNSFRIFCLTYLTKWNDSPKASQQLCPSDSFIFIRVISG